jgi:hypothetical protein
VRQQNENSYLAEALEGSTITAANNPTATRGVHLVESARRVSKDIYDVALKFFGSRKPVTLNQYDAAHHALSESDQWHFFERQIRATSNPGVQRACPFLILNCTV